jgi:predicted 3-demethylubiquinone-9 3-methyltransferase (glyoxalase superfamily)
MQKIAPMLWFDTQAEEAAKFYVSVFKNGSKVVGKSYYGPDMPMREGTVMTVQFELQGQQFTALNGGPIFKFNESISLVVNCKTQAEVDKYWDRLLAGGGVPNVCGWLKDKFGLSWQVVPVFVMQVHAEGDAAKTNRMMAAVMKMKKPDLAELKRAAKG